jgi:hypothetical protein
MNASSVFLDPYMFYRLGSQTLKQTITSLQLACQLQIVNVLLLAAQRRAP